MAVRKLYPNVCGRSPHPALLPGEDVRLRRAFRPKCTDLLRTKAPLLSLSTERFRSFLKATEMNFWNKTYYTNVNEEKAEVAILIFNKLGEARLFNG